MNQLLNEIVSHAYNKVPFYMDLSKKHQMGAIEETEWSNIPFIRKKDIINHMDSFISMGHWPLYLGNKLHYTRTSGSTGKCLDVYWDKNDMKKSLMQLWLNRFKCYGIKPNDNNLNQIYGNVINQFQIIQCNYDVFIVKIALSEEFDEDAIIDGFYDCIIQPSLKDANYYFEFSDALFPDDANGKLSYFRNDMNGGERIGKEE